MLLASILIFARIRHENIESVKMVTVALPLTILGLVLFFFNFGSLNDSTSIRDRIMIPARIGFDYFLKNPFGVPYYQRLEMPVFQFESTNWFALSHNGLLNLIFDYGIFGFLIVIVLILPLRKNGPLLLFFIYLGIQNGSFLDFDKAAIALLVLVFLKSCRGLRDSV